MDSQRSGLSDLGDIRAFVQYWKSTPGMKPELPFLPTPAPVDFILRDPETVADLRKAAETFKWMQDATMEHSPTRARRARYFRMCCLGNILGAEQELQEVAKDILEDDPMDVFALAWIQMRNVKVELEGTYQQLIALQESGQIHLQHIQALVDYHLTKGDLQSAITALKQHRGILGEEDTDAFLMHLQQMDVHTSPDPDTLKRTVQVARDTNDTEGFYQAFSTLLTLQEWPFLVDHVEFCMERIRSEQAVFKCAYVRFMAANLHQKDADTLEVFLDRCLDWLHLPEQRSEIKFMKASVWFSSARMFDVRDHLQSLPLPECSPRTARLLMQVQLVLGDTRGYLDLAREAFKMEGWTADQKLDLAGLVSLLRK